MSWTEVSRPLKGDRSIFCPRSSTFSGSSMESVSCGVPITPSSNLICKCRGHHSPLSPQQQCMPEKLSNGRGEVKGKTCTRLGLRTSNLALVVIEVVAKGPENRTEFCTVKPSESMVCDISSSFTSGRAAPLANNGNKPENVVYLHKSIITKQKRVSYRLIDQDSINATDIQIRFHFTFHTQLYGHCRLFDTRLPNQL